MNIRLQAIVFEMLQLTVWNLKLYKFVSLVYRKEFLW